MLPLEENNLNNDFNMKQYSLFDEESQKTMLNIDLFFKDGPFAYVFLDKFFQVFRINDRFLKLFGLHHPQILDRKSTRLNSSHVKISYAVFCLKKKNKTHTNILQIK